MFRNIDEWKNYVIATYTEVTDARMDEDHWDLLCTVCKVTRGFQVTRQALSGVTGMYETFHLDISAPRTYVFRCPVCKAYKQWVVFTISIPEIRNEKRTARDHYYRVTSVPTEGLEDIEELPQEPASLRVAYRQAVRSMDANANLAAAAMFRRALQIITREVLQAKPGNLANELKEVVGKTYSGGTITTNFDEVAYIVKEAGNQGAHPDRDPDLLDFTASDAEDLQRIFMEVVSELFIIPTAMRKAKDDFLARRKIR